MRFQNRSPVSSFLLVLSGLMATTPAAAEPSASPAPLSSPVPLPIVCEWREAPEGVVLNDLNKSSNLTASNKGQYLESLFDSRFTVNQNRQAFNTSADQGRKYFKAWCKSSDAGGFPASKIQELRFGSTLSACETDSSAICLEYRTAAAAPKTIGNDFEEVGVDAVVRNPAASAAALPSGALSVQVIPKNSADYLPIEMKSAAGTISASSDDSASFCSIAIAGALDGAGVSIPCDPSNPSACSPDLTMVANGKTRFKILLSGTRYWQTEARSESWPQNLNTILPSIAGGGFWEATPPVDKPQKLFASAVSRSGRGLSCAVKIQASGKTSEVVLRAGSDCSLFSSFRRYYFPSTSTGAPVTSGNQIDFKYRKSTISYGKSGNAEVPVIRGILNGAISKTGVVVPSVGGKYTLPSNLMDRSFSAGVVSVYGIDPQSRGPSTKLLYQGVIDYEGKRQPDFTRVSMAVVDKEAADALSSDDLLVMQVFLAKPKPAPGLNKTTIDQRPRPYVFTPVDANAPFDYLVPLMNESCSPSSYLTLPKRGSSPLPNELASMTLCSYSVPFTKQALLNGQVRMNALAMVPVFHGHQFPSQLLRGSAQPSCSAPAGSPTKACWVVDSPNVPKVLLKPDDLFLQSQSCENWEWVSSDYSYCCGYHGNCNKTCTATKTERVFKGYKAGCAIAEGDECGKGVAIRFAGYEQMSMAALGCAVTYDKSGVDTSATLLNQGIIPYSSQFGGGKNGMQSSYTSKTSPIGYGCIPCRFADSGLSVSNTAKLPVDQTLTAGDQARLPIFKFVKSKAPDTCVKKQTVEVRYFGSEACTGFNAPAGHYCTSTNIGNTQCSATKDNIAGRFQVDVCPGGGFEFDKIAVSWSPLLIDAVGNGIHVSRVPQLSVPFDIKGRGKALSIDWPMNTHEVAFLVRPNAQGEVKSIRELFGDFHSKNGFESLRSRMDSNRDGVVDSRDRGFSDLRLWFDRNRNGVAEPQELEELSQHGVKSIALDYSKPHDKGIEGRTLNSTYYNSLQRRFMNLEDVYFYEYGSDGKRVETDAKSGK